MNTKNVALVLGSGGARGVAHIGVINVLEKYGYKITSIAGTSMGALVGGIYADGGLGTFTEWISKLTKRDIFNLMDFTFSKNGIIKGEKIIEQLTGMVPEKNIEDLSIPYTAIATDIINGKEIIFTQGSLYNAIRASISIPTVFLPFKYNNTLLVDGGVLNPIPVNAVKRQKNDMLVVVNVGSRKPIDENILPPKQNYSEDETTDKKIEKIFRIIDRFTPKNNSDKIGYYNLLNKTTSLMIQKISELTLQLYNPDILIEMPRETFGTYEFFKAKEIIKVGEILTQKALETVGSRKN